MKKTFFYSIAAGLLVFAAGCQKMDRPEVGDYLTDSNPPGGPLKFYAAFDGSTTNSLKNAVDSIRALFPGQNTGEIVDGGISGRAYQGTDDNSALAYPNANDFKKSTSFTIAMWLKRTAQAGRTEFLFSLVDPTYDWSKSAAFVLIENQTPTSVTMKFGLMDQWLEGTFSEPIFDGNWHHMAYVYDETTSKMAYYFDGQPVTGLTATQTDVKNGANPRGAVNFSAASNLVLGGWNKHANLAGPTDGWVSNYLGQMDNVRFYGTALSASEVQSLFANHQ